MLTKREAAIISAYTGILMGEFSEMRKFVEEEVLERDLQTFDYADPELVKVIKELSKPYFMKLCSEIKDEINFDNFTPSWYVYTDADGEFHDVVYGYNDTEQFFCDVSRRICFDDCSGETVLKIFWQGKEVCYAGWQPGMKYEYKDSDGNTVWVGYFESWDH